MHVTIVSMSDVPSDPRVLRQASLLLESKQAVRVIGFGTQNPCGVLEAFRPPPEGWPRRLVTVTQLLAARIVSARAVYWANNTNRRMLRSVIASKPTIIHVNDWPSLPIGVAAAQHLQARLVYDSHEYAVGQRADNLPWKLLFQPYVHSIESSYIHEADAVVAVSDGIAKHLQARYELRERPTVIRNTPHYSQQPFRPTGTTLRILYQGALIANRNLESLIISVRDWTEDRRLTLRGSGSQSYEAKLRRLAVEANVAERVEFAPPVAPSNLVSAANEADVGIHPIRPSTVQTNFCLPNKLFEYTMAGLCLAVSSAEEMAALVRRYRLGIVFSDTGPGGIASAVNALTPKAIECYKRNALDAAKELNWECERQLLQALYERLERT